jgi:hypothetical protein
MEALVILFFLIVLIPIGVMIAGIVLLFNSNEATRKRGRNFLLWGIILILVEVLIGYSICSNLNFH